MSLQKREDIHGPTFENFDDDDPEDVKRFDRLTTAYTYSLYLAYNQAVVGYDNQIFEHWFDKNDAGKVSNVFGNMVNVNSEEIISPLMNNVVIDNHDFGNRCGTGPVFCYTGNERAGPEGRIHCCMERMGEMQDLDDVSCGDLGTDHRLSTKMYTLSAILLHEYT